MKPFSKDKPRGDGGKPEHGKGLIPSKPDPKDWQLIDKLKKEHPELLNLESAVPEGEELLGATYFPSQFRVSYVPQVLNQGATPQCVAYSSSAMKQRQDRIDNGLWYNFDEPYFFRLIGGTSNGAALRSAMQHMLSSGYPLVTVNQQTSHRIKAYYAGSFNHWEIKAALMAYGPLVFGLHWPQSWSSPNSYGIVPAPSGTQNGHAILATGWKDGYGLEFQNSWGTGWGVSGRCYIPMRYLCSADGVTKLAAFEIWKTLDLDQ